MIYLLLDELLEFIGRVNKHIYPPPCSSLCVISYIQVVLQFQVSCHELSPPVACGRMTAVYPSGGGSLGVSAVGPQRYARWSRQDSSDICTDDEGTQPRRLTPLEKLNLDMCQDEKMVRELTVGRRIGFYKIRGEIGCGNFSHVKLGIHALTKGKQLCVMYICFGFFEKFSSKLQQMVEISICSSQSSPPTLKFHIKCLEMYIQSPILQLH